MNPIQPTAACTWILQLTQNVWRQSNWQVIIYSTHPTVAHTHMRVHCINVRQTVDGRAPGSLLVSFQQLFPNPAVLLAEPHYQMMLSLQHRLVLELNHLGYVIEIQSPLVFDRAVHGGIRDPLSVFYGSGRHPDCQMSGNASLPETIDEI